MWGVKDGWHSVWVKIRGKDWRALGVKCTPKIISEYRQHCKLNLCAENSNKVNVLLAKHTCKKHPEEKYGLLKCHIKNMPTIICKSTLDGADSNYFT